MGLSGTIASGWRRSRWRPEADLVGCWEGVRGRGVRRGRGSGGVKIDKARFIKLHMSRNQAREKERG